MAFPNTTFISKVTKIATTWLQAVNDILVTSFDRTAAEVTAGVTPTNYGYVPGDVRRYGALVNGAANDAAAWASADAQAAVGGSPIFVPRGADFLTGANCGMATATALIADYRSDIIFAPGAFIKYTGSANITILTIGGTAALPAFTRRYERLFVTRILTDWTDEAAVGIKFLVVYGSHIEIAQVNGCTIGVQTLPNGAGFVYNEVHLGQLYNNKIDLDLSNAGGGWTNENNWYGGRFTVFDGVNTAVTRYAVRITSSDGVYFENNNNHFWKPSIEKNATNAIAEAVCVLMVHGVNNHFHAVRDEENDAPFARESNASSENTYEIGYSSYAALPTIESASSSPNWAVLSGRRRPYDFPRLLWQSVAMHKAACYYDGATNIHVPGVSLSVSASAAVASNLSGIVLAANYVDFGGSLAGPAIFIDTSAVKQLLVTKDCEAGRGGRVVVNCYDAAGAIISTAGSVRGTLPQAFSVTASYGNAFLTNSDSVGDTLLTVTNAVKSVRISLCGGDASIRIRTFAVYAVNAHTHASAWPGYEEIAPGLNIGTAPPSAGAWARGRIVYNATPSAAGTPGWVCTTAGAPGTWKAMAAVAA